MIVGKLHTLSYEFPSPVEPSWSQKVDRWYQLDAAAFGMVALHAKLASEGKARTKPRFLLLASPGASNESDRAFSQLPTSAHKFAHTLPNIRCSPLAQWMGWTGPTLCLQNDPHTVTGALVEAVELLDSGADPVWVLSVTGHYRASLLELGRDLFEDPDFTVDMCASQPERTDDELFRWLDGAKAEPFTVSGYRLDWRAGK